MNDPWSKEPKPTNRAILDHFEDQAARTRLHAEVIRKWTAAGAIQYDFGDLPETIDDVREVSFSDLGVEDNAFLIRFREGASPYLDEKRELFVESVFVFKQSYKGKEGAFVTLVVGRSGHGMEPSADTSRIASAWIDADRSVDDGLTHFGLVGDPVILGSKNLFEIEMFLGEAIARVGATVKSDLIHPHTYRN
ncbi:hypothetical protein J2766_001863 [Agrobacterium tumefaciens]|jgi:hypothetical protein|uniref:Uncharacterized protein n=2 Tax=Agrobacterium TaxID=357 RepID=A0AAW8LX02_AGRTU|nr:hypothetical protein [Agrobacterium tumefaciens]MBP2565274.1 hypothetical protein [Agrobacterium tumefaciens]MDR6703493.1 hypothetical protein [Agrobacterium tumefaciens]UXS45943.1 hypothetical protein FY149_01400 [Agrobacterium tumefaciens]